MTHEEFRKLKVGDKVTIKRGHDKGKQCSVKYVGNNIDGCKSVLVRCLDGEFDMKSNNGNRHLRLTSFSELDVM